MTEERTVYETDKSAEREYLEEEMRKIDLHVGMKMWVRAAYRLRGLRYAIHMVRAWKQS